MRIIMLIGLVLLAGCGHDPEPNPNPKPDTKPVRIGTPAIAGHTYKWTCGPSVTLDNPQLAQPLAVAKCTGPCEVTVQNQCGIAKSAMVFHAMRLVNGELSEVLCANQ